MIKILVVEDEKIFREYVCGLLEWKKYHMEIYGEAKNGVEALKILEGQEINIALVDISMPVMDGIEFCTRAKELYPMLKIILLTGHNEFEYARSALKLGVSDYILKPFDEQELESALLKVQREIVAEQKQRAFMDRQQYDMIIDYTNYLMSDSYLKKDTDLNEYIEGLHAGHHITNYKLAVIEEDFFDDSWKSKGLNTLWRKTVLNMLDELFLPTVKNLCFCNENGKICVLMLFENKELAECYEHGELFKICRMVQQRMGFSITCGVSDSFNDIQQLNVQYDELLTMLKHKYLLGHGTVLFSRDESIQPPSYFYPVIPTKQLRANFFAGDMKGIQQTFFQISESIKMQHQNLEIMYFVYSELISVCLGILSERGENISQIYGAEFMPFAKLRQVLNMSEAMEYIERVYAVGMEHCAKVSYSRTRIIANDTIRYIQEQFSNSSLSVEDVAGHLFINSSYLRSAFKKEMGMTVSDYIFKTRMEKAYELIPKEHVKLTNIASMVGLNDGAYFSKCFKKHFGISPSEYANRVKII